MSGICGVINLDGAPVDPKLLQKMASASAFRGPNGIHHWIDGNAGFAHLTLHTTSESQRERQPLLNRRGNLVLTADARVDNRTELISTLTAKDYLLKEEPTDADLILAAYECWDEDCPEHIIGDFAFAIWDTVQQQLFCARDTAGVRTFCYHLEGSTFWFGSDGRQILADERVNRGLDGYYIADYLSYNAGERCRTVYAAVQKLLPGHCLVVNSKGTCAWRYWHPERNSPIHYRQETEYVEHFKELLFRSVADRLRSIKGAAAITTSGGMDSPSIAAIAQTLYSQELVSTQPVAYTYVFDILTNCDEREYSLTLPAETGIEMHQIPAEQFFYLDNKNAYTPMPDSPVLSYASLNHYLFQQAQSRGCDILMTGFGGDALLTTPLWLYIDHARSGRWWKLWPWIIAGRQKGRSWLGLIYLLFIWPLLPQRLQYLLDGWRGSGHYRHIQPWIHPQLREQVGLTDRLARQSQLDYHNSARQMQYRYITSLTSFGAAMEWWPVKPLEYGLEPRFPLLDKRLADFVMAAPLEIWAHPGSGNSKLLMRQAMADVLPEKIRQRPHTKTSWNEYIKHMMHNQAREALRDMFTNTQMARQRFVDDQILLAEFEAYCDGTSKQRYSKFFYFPICLEQWLRTHAIGGTTVCFNRLQPWQFEGGCNKLCDEDRRGGIDYG